MGVRCRQTDSTYGSSAPWTGSLPADYISPRPDMFTHPREVLGNSALHPSEKRALLAAWASDVCAVEGRPAWRQLPGSGALVTVDDVFDALQALDRATSN
jgi:hypothetical protein